MFFSQPLHFVTHTLTNLIPLMPYTPSLGLNGQSHYGTESNRSDPHVIRTIHNHESPVDIGTAHIHKSPVDVGNAHIHESMQTRVWIPKRSDGPITPPWTL